MTKPCAYRTGGSQCSRRSVAEVHPAVDTHIPVGRGYRLCIDHLTFVIMEQAQQDRSGMSTIIEWS